MFSTIGISCLAQYTLIELQNLSKNKSSEFLAKRAKMAWISISSEELDEAIGQFNGTIGWLTLYGFYKKVSKYLKLLADYGLVGKAEEMYFIPDPLLCEYAREVKV